MTDLSPEVVRIPLAAEPGLRFHHVHAEALAAEIAVMLDRLLSDRHTFVIFDVGGGRNHDHSHYVQFISEDGTKLLGEAVGERHAPDLDARQQLQLMRLGWRLPDDEPNCAGNYWRKWEPPGILDAAQLAALTLVKVYGLDRPDRASIRAYRTQNWPDN